jgi:hypothetical protein
MLGLNLLSKSNLYARMLIFMIIFFLSIVLVSETSNLTGNLKFSRYAALIISAEWATLLIYGVELLRVFGFPRKLILALRSYAALGVIGAVTVANPTTNFLTESQQQPVFILFHVFNGACALLIAYSILKDIFSARETETDHIWGAIVAYFIGVVVFGDIYEIICLIQPGMLGAAYQMGMPNFIECIVFSLNSIAGLDTLYPEAHTLLQKLANIENVVGNLFLVVILGRLLSHPLKVKS